MILPLPVNVALLPALSVRPPVAETVKLPPKVMLEPETVVNTGVALALGPNENAALKFIVPTPLIVSVPSRMVKSEENVTDPVSTLIWALADDAPVFKITAPTKVAVPEVTLTLATRVAVLLVPPIVLVPVTEPVPALMFQAAVIESAVGWLMVRFPPTEKVAFPVWVRELAVVPAVNTRLLQLLVVPVSNE